MTNLMNALRSTTSILIPVSGRHLSFYDGEGDGGSVAGGAEDESSQTDDGQTDDAEDDGKATVREDGKKAEDDDEEDEGKKSDDEGKKKSSEDEAKKKAEADDDKKKSDKDDGKKAEYKPEDYEIKLPEGDEFKDMKLSDGMVKAAQTELAALGIDPKDAPGLIRAFAKTRLAEEAERESAAVEAVQEIRNGWVEEAKKDAEIGGDKWNESVHRVGKALDFLGYPKEMKDSKGNKVLDDNGNPQTHPLRQLLNETGVGDHPEMIRLFARIGHMIGEDNVLRGNPAQQQQQTDVDIFYGAGYGKRQDSRT